MNPRRIPAWLKIGWTLWVAVWMPLYWSHYGPRNFLWFCDIGNFMIAAALWAESSLLFSWTACSVLLVQILFTVDLAIRATLGFHPVGGTEYMFNDDGSNIPLGIRLLSLFHVATPPVLLWAIRKLGFDRRAILWQTATAWMVLPICWSVWTEKENINWVYGPFDHPQGVLKPGLYLLLCMVAYPILLYLPTHLALSRLHPGKPRD